jgi:hypothetical protein
MLNKTTCSYVKSFVINSLQMNKLRSSVASLLEEAERKIRRILIYRVNKPQFV